MMSNQNNKSTLPGLTTEIVTAYLRNHPMAAAEVPVLVATIARELGGLGREPEEPAQPEPAVSIAARCSATISSVSSAARS
jgi:predicted transcriptional regulator